MRKFRILTIDGGGLKGVVPLTILKKVEQLIAPKKIWEYFDFVAGTSTGGLITCANLIIIYSKYHIKENMVEYTFSLQF